MESFLNEHKKIEDDGFTILENVYSKLEADEIGKSIERVSNVNPCFRRTNDLFAIRQFLKELPGVANLILTNSLREVTASVFGKEYFIVKSIYFDKPPGSNWFVAYHQDLTISVDKKTDIKGFSLWTKKQNIVAVQPPLEILQSNFTIRIHLDDTNESNGALKVIPGSHLKGICRIETMGNLLKQEVICNVPKGGIMIMKPLLLHSSNRSDNNSKRRVIHIEFSKIDLPESLSWAEKLILN